MSQLTRSLKKDIFRIVFFQLMMIMGFTVLLFLLKGSYNGLSALAGGLSYWIPTLLFVWSASAFAGARAAMNFLVVFFAGEVLKLLLSGVLFLIAINYLEMHLLYAFIGLAGAIAAFWISSFACLYYSGVKS
jgi:ATP synthase protein I